MLRALMTKKRRVSHNKSIGCGASGAYAPGSDDEEEKGLAQ
jgi:hypothetical protein